MSIDDNMDGVALLMSINNGIDYFSIAIDITNKSKAYVEEHILELLTLYSNPPAAVTRKLHSNDTGKLACIVQITSKEPDEHVLEILYNLDEHALSNDWWYVTLNFANHNIMEEYNIKMWKVVEAYYKGDVTECEEE